MKADETLAANLQPAQELAARLYACGRSHEETRCEVGISGPTWWRWRQLDAFKARVEELTHEATEQSVAALRSACVDAVGYLHRLVRDDTADTSQRRQAASDLVRYALATRGNMNQDASESEPLAIKVVYEDRPRLHKRDSDRIQDAPPA